MSAGHLTDLERAVVGAQLMGAPTKVSLSNSTATSTQLSKGVYEVISDSDCFVLQGASTVTAATATSRFLPANTARLMAVVDGTTDAYVAGIVSSGTGTLYIQAL